MKIIFAHRVRVGEETNSGVVVGLKCGRGHGLGSGLGGLGSHGNESPFPSKLTEALADSGTRKVMTSVPEKILWRGPRTITLGAPEIIKGGLGPSRSFHGAFPKRTINLFTNRLHCMQYVYTGRSVTA